MKPMKPLPPTNPLWRQFCFSGNPERNVIDLHGLIRDGSREAPFIFQLEPDDEERQWLLDRLLKGEPIWFSAQILTFGRAISPLSLVVGHFEEPYLSGPTPPPIEAPKEKM